MISSVKKDSEFYQFLSVIFIIYIITINNLSNTYLSIIAILIGILFIFNPVYILPSLFISSIMGEYFVAFQGIGMSRVIVIVFIIGSIIKLISNKTKIKLKHVGFTVFLCGFNFISAANSISGSITPALTMSLNILMFFCMSYIVVENFDILFNLITINVIIFSIYIFILIITGNSISVGSRLVLDDAVNANRIGMALAQMSAYIFGCILVSKKKKQKILYSLVIIINIIDLLLTGSRSATLGVCISIYIVIIIEIFKSEKFSKKMLQLIIVTLLLGITYYFMSNSELEVMKRFSIEKILESGGTGRAVIWEALVKFVIPAHIWFGVGFGGKNVLYAVYPYVPVARGTHNIVLTIIAQTGIVGAFIYFCFFFANTKAIIKAYMKFDYEIIPLTMIFTAYINGIGEEIFSERFLWFAFGLGFIILRYYKHTLTNES